MYTSKDKEALKQIVNKRKIERNQETEALKLKIEYLLNALKVRYRK